MRMVTMKSVMSTDENDHHEGCDAHWWEWPPWPQWLLLTRVITLVKMVRTNKGDYTGNNVQCWWEWSLRWRWLVDPTRRSLLSAMFSDISMISAWATTLDHEDTSGFKLSLHKPFWITARDPFQNLSTWSPSGKTVPDRNAPLNHID